MNYGVVVSRDSFVFTRCGVVSVSQLPIDSEILGVKGIGKSTKYEKVALHSKEKSATGIRLITQATDSILVPHTLVFSERIFEAEKLCSINEVEFYNPSKSPDFKPGLKSKILDLQPDVAYAIGLMSNIVSSSPKCLAFLVRNATDPKYIRRVKESATCLVDIVSRKIRPKINEGKLGHLWIILKGDAVEEIRTTVCEISPEKVCMKLSSKSLEEFVAGMLDAYINEPLYGGDPVLAFSIGNSVQKRFLQNVLILYGSRIFETSCITSHAPKFLESAVMVGKKIPTRNPTWNDLSEASEGPRLFSRVRSWLEIQTSSANLVFEEEGFSPIVDGLYTYPRILSN